MLLAVRQHDEHMAAHADPRAGNDEARATVSSAALPEGFVARPPRAEEAAAVAAVLNACDVADIGLSTTDPGDVERWWREPGFDLSRDAWVVEAPDGSLAGYEQFEADGGGDGPRLDGYTHPAHLGRGIGSWLLDAAERRAVEDAAERGRTGPVPVFHGCWSGTEPSRLLRARGYGWVRCFLRMGIDLDGPPPPPAWPEGIRVAGLERGVDERAFYEALEEAFADHWNWPRRSFEDWVAHKIDNEPGFDASLWFRAMDGEDVAGGLIARPRAPEEDDAAWVSDLAVRRPWRGRGIGQALLLHAFGVFHERGVRSVMLAVDDDSPTGATRLYERAGMRVVRRIDVFRKDLTQD